MTHLLNLRPDFFSNGQDQAMKSFFCKSLWVTLLVWLPVAHADEITLAVAANFSRAAKALVAEFEQHSGHRVQLSFGSTGAHYAQIINGAPFDAFFAADEKTPERLEDDGRIKRGSRFTYAEGQLILWRSEEHTSELQSREKLV